MSDNYRDRDGQPIDEATWQRLSEDEAYKYVGHTELETNEEPPVRVTVRTRWTGDNTVTNENFTTMVRTEVGAQGGTHRVVARYTTEEAAKEGHNRVVGESMGPRTRMVNEVEPGENA